MSIFKGDWAGSGPGVTEAPNPNPDPARFEILDLEAFGAMTAVRVRYVGVSTFEGVKVMVFRATEAEIRAATTLDPHFSDEPGALSPLVRFRPDAAGWDAARSWASMKGY